MMNDHQKRLLLASKLGCDPAWLTSVDSARLGAMVRCLVVIRKIERLEQRYPEFKTLRLAEISGGQHND
jgi:hypothetical protein